VRPVLLKPIGKQIGKQWRVRPLLDKDLEVESHDDASLLQQRTYVVVLRARAAARFLPNEGFEASFDDVPRCNGTVRTRLRTRWVDEGHDAPLPRELWIEARGPAPSLDDAVTMFGSSGRFFGNLLAFTTNTAVETPEVHVGFDATDGNEEREFLEVFVPDQRGHPSEGKIVRTEELKEVFEAINRLGHDDARRMDRAIQQYGLALRNWYFGAEWLSLAHLYIAAETLTDLVIDDACRRQNLDQAGVAAGLNIDAGDPSKVRHDLEVWARREVIFAGDLSTYRDARYASDGIEHGFLDLSEVNRRAKAITATAFRHLRRAVLQLLGISLSEFAELHDRPPRDVKSLRKMIRGHFVGDGSDPAPAGQEYPLLEWNSRVSAARWEEDKLKIDFEERFTVRCAAPYVFRGEAIEVRGREEPGADPLALTAVAEVRGETIPAGSSSPLATTPTIAARSTNTRITTRRRGVSPICSAAPTRARGITITARPRQPRISSISASSERERRSAATTVCRCRRRAGTSSRSTARWSRTRTRRSCSGCVRTWRRGASNRSSPSGIGRAGAPAHIAIPKNHAGSGTSCTPRARS